MSIIIIYIKNSQIFNFIHSCQTYQKAIKTLIKKNKRNFSLHLLLCGKIVFMLNHATSLKEVGHQARSKIAGMGWRCT